MDHRKNHKPVLLHRRENPSFSSTLLESIYRSIDDGTSDKFHRPEEEMIFCKSESTRKNHVGEVAQSATFRRVEKWMEKKQNIAVLSNSNSNSSSSSSESSFWSSELDNSGYNYYYGAKSSRSSSSSCSSASCYSSMQKQKQKPKPIRTERSNSSYGPEKKMSKALKIYNELKKAKKQPVSPGAKLTTFLNSLFNNKPKNNVSKPSSKGFDEPTTKSTSSYVSTPTCSSARSCLSKTPSSKLNSNGSKRSVRFYPDVSVSIVDEDCQPCGRKNLQEDGLDNLVHVMEENRRVAEAARKLLESYRKSKKEKYEDEDDDDDVSSCSSSDLFELDNLSVIGIERYREELPVYETTHVDTNRAIANGLIV